MNRQDKKLQENKYVNHLRVDQSDHLQDERDKHTDQAADSPVDTTHQANTLTQFKASYIILRLASAWQTV